MKKNKIFDFCLAFEPQRCHLDANILLHVKILGLSICGSEQPTILFDISVWFDLNMTQLKMLDEVGFKGDAAPKNDRQY